MPFIIATFPAFSQWTQCEHEIHERFGSWPVRHSAGVESILIDYPEAAALLGITVYALEKRVARNLIPGVVRTGRRVQFNRERLVAYVNNKRSR